MAEWLQQLDPSKLVLGETVSALFMCEASRISEPGDRS
jgi:hypothetical protein